MLKRVLIALAILIALFVIVGLVLPTNYRVSRKTTIEAPAARVHELVGDLKRWDEWTPWRKADPTIVVTFGPKTTGVGASQTWMGDGGSGDLMLTKSDPLTGIEYDMALIQGEKRIPSRSVMIYRPAGSGTEVEWILTGNMDMPVIGSYFATFMDGLIAGPMFEDGLAKLKHRAEAK